MNVKNTFKELKYKIYQKWYYIWYPFKAKVFTPYNKLKLQNVPKTYSDPCNRIIHANFAFLYLMEKEHGGREKFYKYVKDCNDSYHSNKKEWEKCPFHQVFAANRIKRLLQWYENINWNDPVPISDEYEKVLNRHKVVFEEETGLYKSVFGEDPNNLYEEHAKKEEDFERMLSKNLIRIIKIRESLWT